MARSFSFRVERFEGLRGDLGEDADRVPGAAFDMLNFKVTARGELVKRDGCQVLFQGEEILRGLWCGTLGANPLYAAVFGETLYAAETGFADLAPVAGTVPGSEEVRFFPFLGKLLLLTGAGIKSFDGTNLEEIEPYEPMLTTATAPNGAGTALDDVNALTPKVRQSFIPDGTSKHYHLVSDDFDCIDRIERDGVEIPDTNWYWDDLTQTVTFLTAPPVGPSELVIHYRVNSYSADTARQILSCRHAMAFGGANDTRVFLYGSREAPAARFHSGMAGGAPHMGYFPVLNYTLIGDGAPVTGILRHYDRQLIFTEKAAYTSTISYSTEADGRTRAIFPVLPLSDDRGNLAPGQPLLMENEPVTVTESGLFRWVSTNVRDERNAKLFSQAVRERLQSMDPRRVRLFNRKAEGELYIVCDEEILVYRYGTGAFYRYRVEGVSPGFMAERGDDFYFGAGRKICVAGGTLDLGEPFAAFWLSPLLSLGAKGWEKNLYEATLCADTHEGAARGVFRLITPEGTVTVNKTETFPAGSRARTRRFPARSCHFERARVGLTESGVGKWQVRYLTLRGKICDKKV